MHTPALAETGIGDIAGVVFWSLLTIGAIVVAFLAYVRLKQWMKADEDVHGEGFTLGDLRQLHKQGKMSTEEFERAREKMVASAKQMADKMPDVLPGGRKNPPKSP